jgi:hypothetical protein
MEKYSTHIILTISAKRHVIEMLHDTVLQDNPHVIAHLPKVAWEPIPVPIRFELRF